MYNEFVSLKLRHSINIKRNICPKNLKKKNPFKKIEIGVIVVFVAQAKINFCMNDKKPDLGNKKLGM